MSSSSSSAEVAPPPLVHALILTEFDILKGSTVRHRYPEGSLADCPNDWFAEHMLPEGVHNRASDETIMFLARDAPRIMYLLNVVHAKRDATVQRGAVVKALAIATHYNHIAAFRAPLIMALDHYFESPSIDVLRELYDTLNAVDLASMPRPSPTEQQLMRRGVTARSLGSPVPAHCPGDWVWKTTCTLRESSVPLRFPLYCSPDEVVNPLDEAVLTTLTATLGEQTMRVFNAVLAGKRVLFVGYNHAAQDVCRFVLAAASMVSPPVEGILRRVYPYANLTDLSFLETPGYIAGVTNPVFEGNVSWWDLLVVLNLSERSATVFSPEEKAREDDKRSKKTAPPPPPPPMPTAADGSNAAVSEEREHQRRADLLFISKVLSGIRVHLGEEWVQAMFRDLTRSAIDLGLDESDPELSAARSSDAWKKLLATNAARISSLRVSCNVPSMSLDPWGSEDGQQLGGEEDGASLRRYLRLLVLGTDITSDELEQIFGALARGIQSEHAAQVLLCLLPESSGGLHPIAAALLHKNTVVRKHAAALLMRIESFASTAPAFNSLNPFFLVAFQRASAAAIDAPEASETEH